jgi:uncharacterized protein YqjF (DUF2071 family)
MANYEVAPSLLIPYLPKHTTLDFYNGKCYVSLVGFMFEEIRLKGIPIPFHTRFPEVNLRFYVKQSNRNGQQHGRGVVFIREIVPKWAVAWVANTFYKEKYISTLMKNHLQVKPRRLEVAYDWFYKNEWHSIRTVANNLPQAITKGSPEDFILEHYVGYSKVNSSVTNVYPVTHPSWETYPVTDTEIDCNFEMVYGKDFGFLNQLQPSSVFLAEGSAVAIGHKLALL